LQIPFGIAVLLMGRIRRRLNGAALHLVDATDDAIKVSLKARKSLGLWGSRNGHPPRMFCLVCVNAVFKRRIASEVEMSHFFLLMEPIERSDRLAFAPHRPVSRRPSRLVIQRC